jgi:hypothetical protein
VRLQNDVQREIVHWVKHSAYPSRDNIRDYMIASLGKWVSSPTVMLWIADGVREQINALVEWSIIYEVEEYGEKMGYYQTDWTDEQISAK